MMYGRYLSIVEAVRSLGKRTDECRRKGKFEGLGHLFLFSISRMQCFPHEIN